MVKGPLRGVLWLLGGLGVLWIVLVLSTTLGMGGMAGEGMPGGMGMGGDPGEAGMMGGGSMAGMAMAAMWGVMLAQTVGMLGLAGVFVYLVVDSLRGTGSSPETERGGPA